MLNTVMLLACHAFSLMAFCANEAEGIKGVGMANSILLIESYHHVE